MLEHALYPADASYPGYRTNVNSPGYAGVDYRDDLADKLREALSDTGAVYEALFDLSGKDLEQEIGEIIAAALPRYPGLRQAITLALLETEARKLKDMDYCRDMAGLIRDVNGAAAELKKDIQQGKDW